jgi:hypothetical protein
MDGGSGINVLYASTLDDMGIPRSALRPSTAPFHGDVWIYLPVMFGDVRNFRTETLTFEVVGFSGTYHAILRRPAYAKFMVVPNYTYLLMVDYRIKVHMDLQADKSPIVVKGPFFSRVVNPRYRIRGTNVQRKDSI